MTHAPKPQIPYTKPHLDCFLDIQKLTQTQAYLNEKLAEYVLDSTITQRELTLNVKRQHILAVLKVLRDHAPCQFKVLVDICAVDWWQQPGRSQCRFDVVYHLLSLAHNQRVRVVVQVPEGESVPTVTGVYSAANWYEREAYDLFGVPFSGHPDLRRILTDYGFDGHPMRKDFPLTGHVEAYYDATEQRVAYKPVDLPQELRNFDKQSPWRAMTGNAHLAEEDNAFNTADFQ